jgi:predicted RNase H-like HicB family nuclease
MNGHAATTSDGRQRLVLPDLETYLAVPYVLDARSIQGADGAWLCELEYEELPNCVAQARSPLDALDELERKRIAYLTDCYEKRIEIPIPRIPLRRQPYGRIHEPTER